MSLGKLHLITDTTLQNRYSHAELAELAFRAGAKTVQFREKNYQARIHESQLKKAIRLAHQYDAQLIVNDYTSLAIQLGAQGTHVGQGDTPPEEIISLRPLNIPFYIGVTIHNEAEYDAVAHLEIDYIGVGPVFGTTSKDTGLPPLGLTGLKYFCELSRFPVIAIGSINAANIRSVMDTGVYGVAVLSDFVLAESPQQKTEELLRLLQI
jgi:thiamine-phosphate pyrophosphorylase